jgi:epoxyqueuosine reductase
MSLDTLAAELKAHARGLGFRAAGIARIADPASSSAFEEWLRRGYHGEMAYLSRTADQRRFPAKHLPWARSAVVVAWAHEPAGQGGRIRGVPGALARYARGEDYHAAIAGRLSRLLEWVCAQAGRAVAGRIHVDTGPILERDLAARAGLGWVGKSANLIIPGLGSYLCLGELFLDLDLPPDRPIDDQCGSCRACLDACPTQAFVAPRVLDARRCISYLTTQLRGPIPVDLRAPIGFRLFGCDACQEACPHNAHGEGGGGWSAAEPQPKPEEAESPSLFDLTEERFRTAFGASPVLFVKRRGLLRNACVVLGNSRAREYAPVLTWLLHDDPEPLVRAHAAWALGRIGGPGAAASLEAATQLEPDPATRAEIRLALASIPRG